MFDKKAYNARYRKENPEKERASCKKYRESHREERRAASAKWRKAHPERARVGSAKWVKANSEKHKALCARWYKEHKEKVNTNSAKRRKEHPDKMRAYVAKYRKTDSGKESTRKNRAKRRILGFTPLNEPFPNSRGHHIDRERVIYMPRELHEGVRHSVLRNSNMEQINKIAFSYLEAS